jgi:Uma2 family endonuclease
VIPPVTVADLLKRLGNIPASRVRLHPTPGTATVRDIVRVRDREKRLCELVEGVLVEKPMGYEESVIALLLGTVLNNFVLPRQLGIVAGEAGMLRLAAGLVRIPDISFISIDRFPNHKIPKTPMPALAPDLAVEVLSKGNTKAEMARKVREYFEAGTRLVWILDLKTKTVRVHTEPKTSQTLGLTDTLDGGDVLPGFRLDLRGLFSDHI